MELHIRDFRQSDKAELSRLCETGRLIGALPRHAGGARPLSRATCSLPWWIWTFSRMNAQASCAGLYKPAAPPEHEAESSARDPSGRSHPGHSRSTRHLRTVGSARCAGPPTSPSPRPCNRHDQEHASGYAAGWHGLRSAPQLILNDPGSLFDEREQYPRRAFRASASLLPASQGT